MAAALAASVFEEGNVQDFADLLKWDLDGGIEGIQGIHELRVAALVFAAAEEGMAEGKVCLHGQILNLSQQTIEATILGLANYRTQRGNYLGVGQSWGWPTIEPNEAPHATIRQRGNISESPNNMLDLAVLLGYADLAILLARHGVRPSIHLINPMDSRGVYWGVKRLLAAVIIAGGFMEEASLAAEWLGEELMDRAIFSGRAEIVNELKEHGAHVPEAEEFWSKLVDERLESLRNPKTMPRICRAAACAGVDLQSPSLFHQVQLRYPGPEPSDPEHLDLMLLHISLNLLDLMLLQGSVESAWELLKAKVCISPGMDRIVMDLQASSGQIMIGVSQQWDENIGGYMPLGRMNFCAEKLSQLLQLAIASAGQQYGVPLLQCLPSQAVLHNVLDFLVVVPISKLRNLALLSQSSQAYRVVPSSTRRAEVVEVSAADWDGEAEGETDLPEMSVTSVARQMESETSSRASPQPSHTSAHGEHKVPDAEEMEQVDAVIKRSRQDIHKLSGDNAVLFRITRRSQTPETVKVLQESPQLAHCHRRVQEAGCEFAPSWAGGAKFFVPITREQLVELAETGFEIEKDHLLALRQDKKDIEEALGGLRGKHRVKVRPEHGWSEEGEEEKPLLVEEMEFGTDSEMGFPIWPGTGSSGNAAVRAQRHLSSR